MSRAKGFTLLEILVVMAIVVVVLGVAVARLEDSGERDTGGEADRLSVALEAARDDAIYSGRQVAFSTDGDGYQFWVGDDRQNRWQALADTSTLAPGKLRHAVKITAQYVNGRKQHLGERLIFSADGLSEPFALLLQRGQTRFQVASDVLGQINVKRVNEDD